MHQAPEYITTLVFLLKDNQILLALKKRGFGQGKWNGVGGKAHENETVEQAAIREAQEEINITPQSLEQHAILTFYYIEDEKIQSWEVHAFICTEWAGEIQESEEMRPQWFNLSDIPYSTMWPDDQYWLPKVLAKEHITGEFIFQNNTITTYKISPAIISPLAVTIICLNQDGDVLLKNRTKSPDQGKWELIGGHVKPGERLKDSVQRILKDKVNIYEIISTEFTGHYYDDPNRHPGNPCLPLTFKVRTPNAHLKEVKNAAWFEPKFLPELEYALDNKQMLLDAGIL